VAAVEEASDVVEAGSEGAEMVYVCSVSWDTGAKVCLFVNATEGNSQKKKKKKSEEVELASPKKQ
jgi:hypothetical protein